MEVVLADAMGWCFGVRDAVEMALRHPRRAELTIVGELVHDETVLDRLRGAGLRLVPSYDSSIATPLALVTAHGASHAAMDGLRARGLAVTEATCPLVRRAHDRLAALAAEGRHPVVVGKRGHVEVIGLTGDLPGASVIESPEQVGDVPRCSRIGVVAQTTQVLEDVLEVVAALRRAQPGADVKFIDTICHPTKERQAAARRLAAQVDRVVVVGGPRSHNTRRLVMACEALGTPADRVQRPEELEPERYRGLARVGLTAGTSAPDDVIEAVVARLREIASSQPEMAGASSTHAP